MHACWHRLGPDQRQPSRASTDARSPAPSEPRPAPTGPQPTVTRSQGARHTAPPPAPLGLRFRALLGLGFVPPPEPQPCAHCASIAYALLPAARIPLYRHRADPESSSRSLPSGSPARLARIAPTACRHPHPSMSPPSRSRAHRPPHRAHRAPTSASRPISLLALRRPQGPDWQEPHRMHPFFAECAKKAPFLATSARNACFSRSRWQHPRPMRPFSGAIGRFRIHGARILPPRALFRVEEPEITHGAKMLPAPPGLSAAAACGPAARPFRGSGLRSGRTGFAPCGAGLACLPHAPPLPSCLCPPRPALPRHLARVHRRRLIRVALRHPHRAHRAPPFAAPPIAVGASRRSGSSCCPRAAHADASRPPMRARWHRPAPTRANRTPALSQPSPAHPWSRLRPPVPRHPPRLTLPRGSRCGSRNSREMVR